MSKFKYLLIFPLALAVLIVVLISYFNDNIYNNKSKITSLSDKSSFRNYERNFKEHETEAKLKEISGTETIWSYEADKDMSIDTSYLFKVLNGEAKLVLINPDNTVTNIVESTQDSTVDTTV